MGRLAVPALTLRGPSAHLRTTLLSLHRADREVRRRPRWVLSVNLMSVLPCSTLEAFSSTCLKLQVLGVPGHSVWSCPCASELGLDGVLRPLKAETRLLSDSKQTSFHRALLITWTI